jgi:hypothetical protein
MREALMLQLEKLSYYQHLSLSGGQERPIYCCRVVDIRGSRYHVLSRIQDAGLDFTGRTNFLAHHLVFTPEEVRRFPSPPVILRGWSGWVKSWSKEPQLLENEDWSGLAGLSGGVSVPATNWQQVTGDAVNGYGLLESRAGMAFRVDNLAEEQILALFAESLELLELRDPRRDFRATAWQYTFTTSMQEQDNPADFRWRCLHSDNPVSNRVTGPDCRPLSDVRALRVTDEEMMFARSGRQPPRFVIQPQNIRSTEGETARLHTKAEGVPSPSYQWFAVDRAGNGQIIANGTDADLVVQNPPLGLSRYVVRANNSLGDVTSEVATLSVEQKLRLQSSSPQPAGPSSGVGAKAKIDVGREFESLNSQYGQNEANQTGRFPWKWLLLGMVVAAALVLGAFFWHNKQPAYPDASGGDRTGTNVPPAKQAATRQNPAATNSNTPPNPSPTALQPRNKGNAAMLSDATSSSTPSPKKLMRQEELMQLPAPWTYTNVGNPNRPPTPTSDHGTYTFIGTGKKFSGSTDSFFFASQPVSNSVEFIARLSKVSRATNVCQCGIMLRESNIPNAPFAFVGISSTNVIWTYRLSSGADCESAEVSPAKLPIFLRLRRNTDLFIGDISTNGIDWNCGQTNRISMTESNYLLGFAVTSGESALEVNADFDSVTNRLTKAKP